MFTNKLSKNIALNKESLIYAGIFVVYVSVTITIFVYSIKFLGTAINLSLSEPLGQTLEQKYGQVNLDNYSLIARKLNFLKGNPNIQNSTPFIPPAVISTTTEIINSQSNMPESIVTLSSSSDISLPTTQSEPSILSPVDIKPSIVVINSTLTSGLASALKTQFQSSNFEVLRIGNVRPSEVNTVIKVKANVNQNSVYFSDIKKIVSERYDYILGILEDTADHDIEVIIGEK